MCVRGGGGGGGGGGMRAGSGGRAVGGGGGEYSVFTLSDCPYARSSVKLRFCPGIRFTYWTFENMVNDCLLMYYHILILKGHATYTSRSRPRTFTMAPDKVFFLPKLLIFSYFSTKKKKKNVYRGYSLGVPQ